MGKIDQRKFKVALGVVLSFLLIIGYQNCAQNLPFRAKSPSTAPIGPEITLEQMSLNLIRTRCYVCHAGGRSDGNFGYADDLNHMKQTGMIVEGNPLGSRLYLEIHNNEMPPASPFSASDKQVLYDWILGMGITSGSVGFAEVQTSVLNPKCVSCHDPQHASFAHHQVSYKTYASTMETVIAGNPAGSLLYDVARESNHPDSGGNPFGPASTEQIDMLYHWIQGGAPQAAP